MKRPLGFATSLFVILIIIGVDRGYHFLADGFDIQRIQSDVYYDRRWDIVHSDEDQIAMQNALVQKYTYLASGSQSYVFESEDKQYVIKFFKYHKWRTQRWLSKILMFKKWNDHTIQKNLESRNNAFQSYLTSYELFKENTGIIYIHLNKTKGLHPDLTIIDKLKTSYTINLDQFEFTLQRKAVTTNQKLLALKQSGANMEALNSIAQLINFMIMRSEKGFSDKDPHLIRNFGFLGDKVVEIDIGGFHYDPRKNKDYFYDHELILVQSKLCGWLKQHYPELIPPSQALIKEIRANRNYQPINISQLSL